MGASRIHAACVALTSRDLTTAPIKECERVRLVSALVEYGQFLSIGGKLKSRRENLKCERIPYPLRLLFTKVIGPQFKRHRLNRGGINFRVEVGDPIVNDPSMHPRFSIAFLALGVIHRVQHDCSIWR